MSNTASSDGVHFWETHIPVSPESSIYLVRHKPVEQSDVTVFYLTGYRDSHEDIKVLKAREAALQAGASFVAFDYRGHGSSEGPVRNERLLTYHEDACMAYEHGVPAAGKVIFVGHSIGAHLEFLLAEKIERETPGRLAAVIGVSPVHAFAAPGRLFSRILRKQEALDAYRSGRDVPNPYVSGMAYSRQFIDDYGDHNLVESPPVDLIVPVEFIVGPKDHFAPLDDVKAVAALKAASVSVCEGDHTMSGPVCLMTLQQKIVHHVLRARASPAEAVYG